MIRKLLYFAAVFCIVTVTNAATRDAQLTNTTKYNYNYMYPYLNNQMRTDLNPGVTNPQVASPINSIVRTSKLPGERRVVPRPTTQRQRTASTTTLRSTTPQRQQYAQAMPARTGVAPANNASGRRVVARSGKNSPRIMARETTKRINKNSNSNVTTNYASTEERVSSARCLADYTECMNSYCERANTAYKRCYCSSKLSQIDAKYQNDIESLIKQILTIKDSGTWSDSEMNEYWMKSIGKHYGSNSWTNIDDALTSINWTDLDSRVRGQNAFATGHQFCSQHLTGCYYMSTNLRDAYRSEISRDCAAYEQYLYKIKNAAESIVESYK